MKKPIQTTSVTIHLPDTMSKEDQQKMAQAILKELSQKQAQEKRDYEMYEKGRRDSGGGFFGGLF